MMAGQLAVASSSGGGLGEGGGGGCLGNRFMRRIHASTIMSGWHDTLVTMDHYDSNEPCMCLNGHVWISGDGELCFPEGFLWFKPKLRGFQGFYILSEARYIVTQ